MLIMQIIMHSACLQSMYPPLQVLYISEALINAFHNALLVLVSDEEVSVCKPQGFPGDPGHDNHFFFSSTLNRFNVSSV